MQIKSNVGFEGEEKTGVPGENFSVQSREPKNSTHIIMTLSLGIEPGPHWWEARALTTVTSLCPKKLTVHYTLLNLGSQFL